MECFAVSVQKFASLDFLPESLFNLPSLMVLDVSNNKLHHLPKEMWTAPKLKEINASFNLLTDLPNYYTGTGTHSLDLSTGMGFDLRKESFSSSSSVEIIDVSFSEDDSLDDARMMRSIQLATINLTPQELIHHRCS